MLFWLFLCYSFLGYLLEKAFAVVTRAPQQGRKCFLLLPLCPVYGLGVLAVLALPTALRDSLPKVMLWGGLTATAVEYGVHWLYETVLGVKFWDYTGVLGNLRGRVCLPFSLAWGLLIGVALAAVQPLLVQGLPHIPEAVTLALLLVFTGDAICSMQLLRRHHDIALLRWRSFAAALS
ncbi:MAG: putative ABC transporter permease [Oscillospiraceae bacterium]